MTGADRRIEPSALWAVPLAHPGWRWAGRAAGALLLLAAALVVARHGETLGDAQRAVARPDPGLIALLLAAIAANIACSALMAWRLIRRYGRVGLGEMTALITAATLLNYLPLKAGLVGRVTYHWRVNGIPVASTLRTIIEGAVISGLAALYAGATLLAIGQDHAAWPWAVAAPLPLLAAAACAARAWRDRLWAALARYLDLLAWSVRYAASFALLGTSLSPGAAVGLACAGMVASLLPLGGNGLGAREWAIGMLGTVIGGWALERGVAADLLNRAAELLVIVPLGLIAMAWLWRGPLRRPAPRSDRGS